MLPAARFYQRILSVFLFACLIFNSLYPTIQASTQSDAPGSNASTQNESQAGTQPEVGFSERSDTSPALLSLQLGPVSSSKELPPAELPRYQLPGREQAPPASTHLAGPDISLESFPAEGNMPVPSTSFAGLSNEDNFATLNKRVVPPDTSGAVGFDSTSGKKYFLQWVNLVFAIWDVTGTPVRVYGPAAGNTFWQGFGGICESSNDGDVIVLFDELAGRWFLSQFALNAPDGNHQCMAVSATSDPTGAWHRYDFLVSSSKINDYPKFGVWPDAYYMAANQFDSISTGWAGQTPNLG